VKPNLTFPVKEANRVVCLIAGPFTQLFTSRGFGRGRAQHEDNIKKSTALYLMTTAYLAPLSSPCTAGCDLFSSR